MDWIREAEVLPPAAPGEPDSIRAWRPWVLEADDGTIRMWYSGNDRSTPRILEAVQRSGTRWQRIGPVIEPGFAGDSDGYGVESPSVVQTPGGFFMAYGGFDSEVTRLHGATSTDGHQWSPHGPILQRGMEDLRGASHPCLLVTGERWWLFYTGYTGAGTESRGAILAAVSATGASWDRVGPVIEPSEAEVDVSHPCVLDLEREFRMFYAADDANDRTIALATSCDGVSWDRRGTVLGPSGEGPDGGGVHTPCAVRLRDGSLQLWYAGLPSGDRHDGYRICSARFAGSDV